MCDFKKSTESLGLKIHPDKTKILRNQGSSKRIEVSSDNIKLEVLPVKECAKCRTKNNVRATRDNRDKESSPSSLGIIYQLQNRSLHRNRTFYDTDFAYSTWSSPPR